MRYSLLAALLLVNAWSALCQSDSVVFQLIVVGDGGNNKVRMPAEFISRQVPRSSLPSAVVFVGDNIYPKGLPDAGSKGRKEGEQILLDQVSMASGYGDIFFVPGNHDWKNGHHDGFRYRLNQELFLDSIVNPKVRSLPRDGCPGPEEIHLSDSLVLVILDTQWFLHPWTKPQGEGSLCENKSESDVAIQLDDILNRNLGKRIIVAGHHPVFTYGPHGGVFTFKDHLFPLTEISKDLYLPLPVIGSLVPLYRKIFGDIQDIAHPQNKSMRRSLQDVMEQYPGTIYVSGHEHAQQYIEKDTVYYVVSGAGSKSSKVKVKGYSKFGSSDLGFSRILILKDGRVVVEYYSDQGKLYSAVIPKVKPPVLDQHLSDEKDTLWVTTRASSQYIAGNFRRSLLGENYRAEWAQKITLTAFDIGREKGGLTILQKGGGTETMALRVKDSTGREYNLRSVEKYAVRGLPQMFRKTFIQAFKQDHVSASHPYAALVIPPLAEGAGIYHTNPKLIYAPNDVRWGTYRKDFAGQIMLFEERPDGSGKGQPFFGNPEKIISTRRLLEHMRDDNDYQVDQKQVLRSRLFDMWIGDWDRHDDQWRWGEFDIGKSKIFKPIPRDRDQAFFVNEGFVAHQWKLRYRSPQFEGFNNDIQWAPGLMLVGRWFDRTFLNQMSERDFINMSKDLSSSLSDAMIDSALKKWPKEIYDLHAKEIAAKLKARRSVLEHHARTYYQFLARAVDVVGSNKREWFEAVWLPGGNLNVKMYKHDKEGRQGKLLYEREFINGITRELRLYGLEGDDMFHFSGKEAGEMKIRVIGGGGQDEITNETEGSSKLILYDNKGGVTKHGHDITDKTSTDPTVNEYDRKAFEYNKFMPRHTITYNVDDGLFVGTGFSTIAHGFRKKPYQSHHFLQGSYAIRTQSFQVRYEGRFPHLIGKWDLELDADAKSPNYVNNFFGWGNESVFDQNINEQPGISVTNPIDYYRLRFREFKGEIRLRRKIGQWGYFRIGPVFQRGEIVNPSEDRYIKVYDATLPQSILGQPRNFGGFMYTIGIDKRDNAAFTTRGIIFKETSRFMDGFDAPSFSSHNATFTLYQSFRLPARITYVFNAGGGHNAGSYQLYQAQTLDGKTEVRGFHKTRFYGDTRLYFNNEVRIKLGSLRTYLFPAAVGIHLFYDVGRVWYKDVNGIDPSSPTGVSDDWHKGYGAGLWLVPYELTTIVTEVAHSKEGNLFYLRLGFLF